ncbi:TPA: hypothetical protein EYP70_03410, partial [Candidatus Bathyarchaeota archaeon]|nr:hypothetical protein [Candidatus Bathyarchaeota archaeon]
MGNLDELKRRLISYLLDYLRERMDFIASLPTMDPSWTAPLDIIGDLIEPLLDNIKDPDGNPLNKCPRLFLLLDNILRSEEIRAGGIAFEIKVKKEEKEYKVRSGFKIENGEVRYKFEKGREDIEAPLAVYLGVSGCQAFYGIIENILRNSGRHSDKAELEKVRKYSEAIKNKTDSLDDAKPLTIIIEFDYDQHEDFVRVKIYDNLSGWRRKGNTWVKDRVSLKKLDVLLRPEWEEFEGGDYKDGRIIDETGNIVQGNWGFKEMRICASFLRGLKIEDYEKEIEPRVIKPMVESGSLGFQFFIPKVKHLLIVSREISDNREINKEDLANQGIYIVGSIGELLDLQRRGIFTHEFVAIDINEEESRKYVEENRLLLPYKLFFIAKNENREINSSNENLTISKDEITELLSKGGNFKINSKCYNILPKEAYLVFHKRWNEYLWKSRGNLPKVGLYHAEEWNDELTFSDQRPSDQNLPDSFLNKCKKSILLLHRFDRFDEIKIKEPLAIIPFAHGVASPITKIKEGILINRENLQWKYLLNYLNAIEMGLTNIVIIDERAFSEAKRRRAIYKDVNSAFCWYLQNVVVFNLDKKDDKFVLKGYKINL